MPPSCSNNRAEPYRLYERFARAFDRDRGRELMERGHLDAMLARLPARPRVLDLGCGSGEPIARHLIEQGCKMTGVDAAPAMIALCRERFPDERWLVADMRSLDLGRRFEVVLYRPQDPDCGSHTVWLAQSTQG